MTVSISLIDCDSADPPPGVWRSTTAGLSGHYCPRQPSVENERIAPVAFRQGDSATPSDPATGQWLPEYSPDGLTVGPDTRSPRKGGGGKGTFAISPVGEELPGTPSPEDVQAFILRPLLGVPARALSVLAARSFARTAYRSLYLRQC
jgi:hypothetical protein